MVKKKKKAVAKNKKETFSFSQVYDYYLSLFGIEQEQIEMYVLNLAVGDLLEDFKVFEDLNNVQSWPISTLIQRELDHKRASLICKDYLLQKGDTKYFPPLIAVLIPTDSEYKPLDMFPQNNEAETIAVAEKYVKGAERFKDYEEVSAISGGISQIPFDDLSGGIVWDKNAMSAVIIDGQHRYKALQEAVDNDKEYKICQVAITLIELSKLCKKTKKTPTEIARDLFVTINSTPMEVDETRLVLMDDKDSLATFTQVLIDDSFEGEYEPAVQPELIDWECEGAKHNLSNSISGVLVLRQIILSAMFDDAKISTVDDRTNVRNVRKWKGKIEDWLDPDKEIKKSLGAENTISNRFKIAEEEIKSDDDDEEDSMFLFSFGASVSNILKLEFQKLFLPSFRTLFNELAPYEKLNQLAKNNGVMDIGSELNNYYRAFKGKRSLLLKGNAELKKQISKYEKEFFKITKNSIPHTVMGQKAIFKALFDGFLSTVDKKSGEKYLESANDFTKRFNDVFDKLCPSVNVDEYFFSMEYKLAKGKVTKAASVGSEYWKGIITKYSGEIDYSRTAVQVLSVFIQDLIYYADSLSNKEGDELLDFQFSNQSQLIQRHKRILNRLEFEDDLSDEELTKLAEKVVKSKQKEITRLLGS